MVWAAAKFGQKQIKIKNKKIKTSPAPMSVTNSWSC
jgi:hypothetical protein